MGIENGDKISDLNPLWPLGTDPVSQGDDQLRLIKNVMVNDALGKSEGGTISADLTIDADLTVDNITADNITADNVTANSNLTALSSGFGGTFEPVLTARQTRPSKSLEQNIIKSATDAIGAFSGFQFEVSKGDATADTDLIASINRNGLQAESINVTNGITFGTGTDALDDYEEGTWTPTSSGAGTITVTSGACYTKVGRNVTLRLNSGTFSNITSPEALGINGIPFAPSGSSAVGVTMMSRREDTICIATFIPNDVSELRFYQSSTTGGFVRVKHNILTDGANACYVQINYQTA